MVSVAELWIYPIKSCGGIRLSEALVTITGLLHDRLFILRDASGRMVTQRECSRMCLVACRIDGDTLHVSAPDMPSISLPLGESDGPFESLTIWDDSAMGRDHGDAAAGWFSLFLGEPVRLIRQSAAYPRIHESSRLARDIETGFADAYPLLITSEESLADLNARLDTPVPMNRFRPNIVVRGCNAWEEDEWPSVTFDGVELLRAKPCMRCPIPGIDQATAERDNTPLVALAKFRRTAYGAVMFGSNYVPVGTGSISATKSLNA